MEYTEDQLTEWCDVEKQKPSRDGVYQALYEYDEDSPTYSLFENGVWHFLSHEPKWAKIHGKGLPTRHIVSQWRGLNRNPSPKKPSNKRKTMYVVMTRVGSEHYPMACFALQKNAEEYMENCRANKSTPEWMRIEKIRFRTPEA